MSTIVQLRNVRTWQAVARVITHRGQTEHSTTEKIRKARQAAIRELLDGRSPAMAAAIGIDKLSGRRAHLLTDRRA